MSRIDDLVTELCPDGVEHVALGELLDYEQPTRYLVASTDYSDDYATPVLTAGQSFVLGRTNESHGIYRASPAAPVIIFDDFTTAFRWVDFPFKAKSSAMKMLKLKPDAPASFRYVFYAMLTIGFAPQEHARHWIGRYSEFRVPLPPLPVQLEIVRLLDSFTDLEAELESELEARRKQYAHYRDALLSFRESGEVRWVPMGELGSMFGGLTGKSKADFIDGNARFVSYVNVFNNSATNLLDGARVRVRPAERQRTLIRGDLLLTGSSESAAEVAMSSVLLDDPTEATYLNSFSIGFRFHDSASFRPSFLRYLFRATVMREQLVRTASGVTRFNVSKARLAKVLVPQVALDEQERIVGILDTFDALVNDPSVGLPAELAARRTQYEYYRDRLLTFDEVA